MTARLDLVIGIPIELTWYDAASPSESWVDLPYDPLPGKMLSRGFVAGTNDLAIAITHTVSQVPSAADPISIPWACVIELTVVES